MDATRISGIGATRARRIVSVVLAIVIIPLSATVFAGSLGIALPTAPLVNPVMDTVASFRSVNAYGLFAVMTTTRPEIVLEGSDEGRRGSSMNSGTRPVIFTDVRRGLPHFNRAWTGKCGLQRSADSTKSGGFRISACDFSKTREVS